MGLLSETIRSIQCTGRVKDREPAKAQPLKAARQTFEEHREEYRFLAPAIQVEEPAYVKPTREASQRFYKKFADDLKKTYSKPDLGRLSSRLQRVDLAELANRDKSRVVLKKDDAQDADPAYVHKLLDWAEDKIPQVTEPLSTQPGVAGSPTLCHVPVDAPSLVSELRPETELAPSPQFSAPESLADAPELKAAPPSDPILKASDFRVLKLLGKGGQGTVLLVEHKLTAKIHALKIMTKFPEKAEDKENKPPTEKDRQDAKDQGREVRKAEKTYKRIYEEQSVMRSIALAPREATTCFLDFEASFHDTAHFYFLTGYVTRGDLWTEMERHKATGMHEGMILGYAAEIIHILTRLHSFSVLHRDFKPDNILIDADGHLLLADFGISRAFGLPADGRPWVKEEPSLPTKLSAPVLVKHASGSSFIISPPSPANKPEPIDSAMHHIPAAPTPANTETTVSQEGGALREERFRQQEERDALARHARLRAEVEVLQQRKCNLRKLVRAQLAAKHMTLSVCGTPGFVAPEVYRGPAYSYGADVWAAGVIVYKMAFGKLPFGLTKKMEMQDRVKQTCCAPLEFPEDGRRVDSPALKDLLSKMLERDPAKRPEAKDLKLHPYFSTIDWDSIARREGSGPGAKAHAAEKKSDKKITIPAWMPYLPGEDPSPWMNWMTPALRDRLAARSAVHSAEPAMQDGSLGVDVPRMSRSRSSRLMQRCKSVWKLSASQGSGGVEC